MIYSRTAPRTIGYGDFVIDKGADFVSIPSGAWTDGIHDGTAQDILNNSFANSTNSFGPGKFYDFGLQKQWDNNFKKIS